MKSYFCFAHTVAALIPIILLSACSSDSANTVPDDNNAIVFEPCDAVPGLDCGAFEVPLIHDSTDNRKINIEVARLPGTGDGPHEPLLFIEGGPGSGTEVLSELSQSGVFPDAIRERYDIIGFDHRGVGSTLQVDCDQLGNASSVPYPRDQSDVMTVVNDFTMLADSCLAELEDHLQWVGSNAVVQDMEIMRSMLNTPELNIISISFGTRITALYLERFPESSGRIIMDAPLAPDGTVDTIVIESAAAQQASFDQMLNACGTTLPDCDRSVVEAAFVARLNSILDSADVDTLSAFFILLDLAIDESEVGESLAPLLIDYAINGDPANLFAVIQEFGLDGDEAGGVTLERAVVCADDAARPSAESLLAKLGRLNESSDFFAEKVLPMAAGCVGWPAALQPVSDIRTTDAPASLVIGGTGDVRTPISLAIATANAIGGVLVSSDHQGHGTVFVRENDCVDSIVVEFLVEGTLPLSGTSCN